MLNPAGQIGATEKTEAERPPVPPKNWYWKVMVGHAKYGLGVYSLAPFSAGDAIGRIEGTVIYGASFEGSEHCIDLADDQTLDPDAPFRFLNHCCTPNCVLVQYRQKNKYTGQEETQTWVEALREIRTAEHLTIDYAWSAESAIPCGCRSEKCRKWIVDEEQLPLIPFYHPVEATPDEAPLLAESPVVEPPVAESPVVEPLPTEDGQGDPDAN